MVLPVRVEPGSSLSRPVAELCQLDPLFMWKYRKLSFKHGEKRVNQRANIDL